MDHIKNRIVSAVLLCVLFAAVYFVGGDDPVELEPPGEKESVGFIITKVNGTEYWSGDPRTRHWVLVNKTGLETFLETVIEYDVNHTRFRVSTRFNDSVRSNLSACDAAKSVLERNKCLDELRAALNVSKEYAWSSMNFSALPVQVKESVTSLDAVNLEEKWMDMPSEDGVRMSLGWGSENWTLSGGECEITEPVTKENMTIQFQCNPKIASNLTTNNITWVWNATTNNEYNITVASGGRWQSLNDSFQDYGGNGYDLQIYLTDGGWANLSSVKNCEGDLVGITAYEGSTIFIDNYYGYNRCVAGTWSFYGNITLNKIYKDSVLLYVDSGEGDTVVNNMLGASTVTGNLTNDKNLMSWTTSFSYYSYLVLPDGYTNTADITGGNAYRVYYRTNVVNLDNALMASGYTYCFGEPTTVNCRNNGGIGLVYMESYHILHFNSDDSSGYCCAGCGNAMRLKNSGGTFRGYIDFNANPFDNYELSYYVNRTFPVCLYSDTYETPVSDGCSINLTDINNTVISGVGMTTGGCVNVTLNNINGTFEFDTVNISAEGATVRNISMWSDSTEQVGVVYVGFKIADVSSCSAPPVTGENNLNVTVHSPVNNTVITETATPDFMMNCTGNASSYVVTIYNQSGTPLGTDISVANNTVTNITINTTLENGDHWLHLNCSTGVYTNSSGEINVTVDYTASDPCSPPVSGTWTINQTCYFSEQVVNVETGVLEDHAHLVFANHSILNVSEVLIRAFGSIVEYDFNSSIQFNGA